MFFRVVKGGTQRRRWLYCFKCGGGERIAIKRCVGRSCQETEQRAEWRGVASGGAFMSSLLDSKGCTPMQVACSVGSRRNGGGAQKGKCEFWGWANLLSDHWRPSKGTGGKLLLSACVSEWWVYIHSPPLFSICQSSQLSLLRLGGQSLGREYKIMFSSLTLPPLSLFWNKESLEEACAWGWR